MSFSVCLLYYGACGRIIMRAEYIYRSCRSKLHKKKKGCHIQCTQFYFTGTGLSWSIERVGVGSKAQYETVIQQTIRCVPSHDNHRSGHNYPSAGGVHHTKPWADIVGLHNIYLSWPQLFHSALLARVRPIMILATRDCFISFCNSDWRPTASWSANH